MKRLIKLGFVLLALAVIGVVVAVTSLDRIAAESIRRGGTRALGVETDVESVDLSLGGEVTASLRGLTVANPEGFQSERFLALGEGSLVFPLKGILADVVTVPELDLTDVAISLERKDGETNYDVILSNLERSDGGSDKKGSNGEKKEKERKEDDGKRYAIDRIVLKNVDATIDLLPLAGDATRVSIHLPEIVIEDLSDDMSTAEIFDIVIRTLLTAVIHHGGDLIPADMLKDLGARLGALGEVAFDLTGGAAQATQEVLSKGTEILKDGAGKIGEEAGEALKGLGGILKPKKD